MIERESYEHLQEERKQDSSALWNWLPAHSLDYGRLDTASVNNRDLFVCTSRVNKTIVSEKTNYKIFYLIQNSNCFICNNYFASTYK